MCYEFRELASQEMWELPLDPRVTDRFFEEMLYGRGSPRTILEQKFVDPRFFIRIIEFIFDVSIHLFDPRGNPVLPNYREAYRKYLTFNQRHVLLSVNPGTEFDLLDFPQCEPIGRQEGLLPSFLVDDPELIERLFRMPNLLAQRWGDNAFVASPVFHRFPIVLQHLSPTGRCDIFKLANGLNVQVWCDGGGVAPFCLPIGESSRFEEPFSPQEVINAFRPKDLSITRGNLVFSVRDDSQSSYTFAVSLTGDFEGARIIERQRIGDSHALILQEYARYKYSRFIEESGWVEEMKLLKEKPPPAGSSESVDSFIRSHFCIATADEPETHPDELRTYDILRDDIQKVYLPEYHVEMLSRMLKREKPTAQNNLIGGFYNDATSFCNPPASLQTIYYDAKPEEQ